MTKQPKNEQPEQPDTNDTQTKPEPRPDPKQDNWSLQIPIPETYKRAFKGLCGLSNRYAGHLTGELMQNYVDTHIHMLPPALQDEIRAVNAARRR